MSAVHLFIDFVLHLDRHLGGIIQDYGVWTYAILCLIIFCETGLVFLPLLPGDSLLFAAGSFAALGSLNPVLLFALLAAAAIVGDNVNYWVGRTIGPRAFSGQLSFLKQRHLDRTRAFFARHGARTIVLARFVPIVRTFTPFVAGVGAMKYPRFLSYDVGGGVLWVGLFTAAGYFFGNLPSVRHNFSLVILAIILISVIPMAAEMWRQRSAPTKENG
ncbi:MAG TPA: DedA family protein [Gemmatimonadales bacterium]|jgi:membrane-associated protein